MPADEVDVAELDRTVRELTWAYGEIGYVPLDRSVVSVTEDKRERLYDEAVDVVDRLANLQQAISTSSEDYQRFWELYRVDLIGIESRDVARKMIAIGRVIERLLTEQVPPDDELKRLSAELADLARAEIEAARRPAMNPAAAN